MKKNSKAKPVKLKKNQIKITIPFPSDDNYYNHGNSKKIDLILDPSKYSLKRKSKVPQKPAMTKRKWKGEHWNTKTKRWELKRDQWYNPHHKKYVNSKTSRVTYTGGWENGQPDLSYFYWFYEFFWDPSKYAYPNHMGECHMEWAENMESGNRLGHLCPRDTHKTTFLVSGHCSHMICEDHKNAKMGTMIVAWDFGLSNEIYDEIKDFLVTSEKTLSFYGYLLDDHRANNKQKLYFIYSPAGARYGLKCASFNSGKITGGHPGRLYLDDIEDDALTETFMKKFKRVFMKKMIPAMGVYGKIFVTGTIKGNNVKNDIYILLQKNPVWQFFTYPAEIHGKMPHMKREVTWEWRTRPIYIPGTKTILISKRTKKPVIEKYIYVKIKDRTLYTTIFPERYIIEDLVAKRIEFMYFDEKQNDDDFWSEYFLKAMNPRGKQFDINRIGTLPPPQFMTPGAFRMHINGLPKCVWIDPGGSKRHGLAMALLTPDFKNMQYYILDLKVCRTGIVGAARVLVNWMIKWGVTTWGTEGNFNQKETFGQAIQRELYRVLKGMAREGIMLSDSGSNNIGNKLVRIETYFSMMLGAKDVPVQLYINKNSEDYEQFIEEVKSFPDKPKNSSHEFDLMDAVTSVKIHLFTTGNFFWASSANDSVGFTEIGKLNEPNEALKKEEIAAEYSLNF